MNAKRTIELARKHATCDSSRLCLADAVALHDAGDLFAAKERATRSLAYSVGASHPDYIRANKSRHAPRLTAALATLDNCSTSSASWAIFHGFQATQCAPPAARDAYFRRNVIRTNPRYADALQSIRAGIAECPHVYAMPTK